MRFLNEIFTTEVGRLWENRDLLAEFEPILHTLPVGEEERARLLDFVRFQLVGARSRRVAIDDWTSLDGFESRAAAFEWGAGRLLDALAAQILPAAEQSGVTFDAVLTATATGNLMPGLGYRLAHRLPGLVRPDSLVVDLSNVGCTGSSKALTLARSLDEGYRNILIAAVEVPSTLAELRSPALDTWQGNCTFGDGAAAVWISSDPERGGTALALESLRYRQRADTGLELIRWGYRDYYHFALADEKTFDREVREHVMAALADAEAEWKEEPRWAIHPAGITLLVRISRKLGIPGEALKPSADHYRERSNMSSASLLYILKSVAAGAPTGAAVNLLTMGAGFNVIYGRVRRVR